jgi:hypothetical protein
LQNGERAVREKPNPSSFCTSPAQDVDWKEVLRLSSSLAIAASSRDMALMTQSEKIFFSFENLGYCSTSEHHVATFIGSFDLQTKAAEEKESIATRS